ncbi:MAG: metallophosphoesterase [Clostridia bacterium]|nr:metallophosphoesterase [Clostridia bacterium]
MTYVIGDIHGNKEKYDAMLEKLSPKDTDAVFVLGDVIDIGDDGIAILQDMMYRANVYPVLGEHEYMAKKFLPVIAEKGSAEKALAALEGEEKEQLAKWLTMKSEKTIADFLSLDEEGREAVLDYFSEFTPYEELEEGGKTFVLAHAGINNFDEGKSLEDYSEEDFVFAKTDYNTPCFSDKYLVTAHTPTVAIGKEFAGKVYSKKRHVAIDCGCGYGGRLAAVCLNPLKVFYC